MASKIFECTLDILPDKPIGDNEKPRDLVFTDDRGRNTGEDFKNDPLTEQTIKRLSYWVGNCEFERADLRLLGIYLFNLLFHGDIRKELERTYNVFDKERNPALDSRLLPRFRLVLKFHSNAKNLAAYPWEFLFMPKQNYADGGFFLAGEDTELILTRFVPGAVTMEKIAPDEKLRILVAYCQPSDLPMINGKDVIAKIKAYIGSAGNIDIQDVENLTYSELKEAIQEYKPHIFHFVGHGEKGGIFVKMTEQEIREHHALYREKKESKKLAPNLAPTLFTAPKPKLVFLESCEGAKSDEGAGLSNAALELVYCGIPAVVAMQYEIENGDALRFSNRFYSLISNGVPIDEAVTQGRRELATNPEHREGVGWNDRRFGTPVLYLQTKNAVIVEAKPRDRCPDCNSSVDPAKRFCPDCGCQIGQCPKCNAMMPLDKGKCGNCHYTVASQVAGADRTASDPSSAAAADSRISPEPAAPAPSTGGRQTPFIR